MQQFRLFYWPLFCMTLGTTFSHLSFTSNKNITTIQSHFTEETLIYCNSDCHKCEALKNISSIFVFHTPSKNESQRTHYIRIYPFTLLSFNAAFINKVIFN